MGQNPHQSSAFQQAGKADLNKSILESTADGILIVDKKGKVIATSSRFAKHWKIPAELLEKGNDKELLSYILDQLVNPGEFLQKVKELYKSAEAKSFDILHFKDGRIFERYTRPLILNGKTEGRVWSFRDVTEQKTAEQELRYTQRKLEIQNQITESFIRKEFDEAFYEVLKNLQKVFKSSFGFFGYINQDGDLVSPSLTREIWEKCQVEDKSIVFPKSSWTGLWGDSLIQRKNLLKNENLIVPEGHIQLENAMAAVIIFKDELIGQIVLGNKEGGCSESDLNELTEICNYIAPLLNAERNEDFYKAELIAAKIKAEESEEKFRVAFYTSPDSVNINKMNGEYVEINQGFTRIMGYTKEDVLGKLSTNLEIWAIPEHRKELVSRLKQDGIVENLESVFRAKDGKLIPALMSARIITLDGEPHILSVTRQIAERKKMEEDLKKALKEAQEADRLKSAFLANVSHEIRTPMNGIMGFTNLLKEPGLSGDEQKEYIDIIQESGERMLTTVNDLIDISRIDTGQVTLQRKNVNLNEEIESLYKFFGTEASKKGLRLLLKNDLTKDNCIIQTDPQKFSSIITHIVKNAIKFTAEGFVEIGCRMNDGEFYFYVKDSGIGIPPERHKAVFDRFVQADTSYSRDFEGSGLGLSITKAYVEMLGGEIGLESEVGVGTTFYFTLPAEGATQVEKEQISEMPGKKPHTTNRKLKILVAEDDETSYLHLSIILKNIAGTLLHASTGTKAVEMAQSNPDIDLILMDIKLPGMDGFEASRKIREFNKNVVIIAQTAYAFHGDREKTLESGCTDYIAKPLNKEDLLALTNKYLMEK
ncbi:MAG: ATP-binding protein [Bacteroidales bacterium]|nr:ATP-binding protein [Bacteroidales bacterium]